MQRGTVLHDKIHTLFRLGLGLVEYAGLLVIAFATTIAMFQEILLMWQAQRVALTDL